MRLFLLFLARKGHFRLVPSRTNFIANFKETRRVTHWQNGKMVIRWLASAFIRTEKRFKMIMGYRDLWTLEAILNDAQPRASAKPPRN